MTQNKPCLRPAELRLSPHMPELLFRHRQSLSNLFHDVLGLHGIDHLSLHLISPDLQLTSFSSTPALMYRLISRNLWQHDNSLAPRYYQSRSFFYWDELETTPDQITLDTLRRQEFGLHHGFTLVRHIDPFYFLYAFATRKHKTKRPPSDGYLNDCLQMGDYCYRWIKKWYSPLCKPYVPPTIERFVPYEAGTPKDIRQRILQKPLQLLINND